jgi:hypothetical protein
MNYCYHCSKFCEDKHFKTKKHNKNKILTEDILLKVVGGEIGLVNKILNYKKDLETEILDIKIDRFSWLERFANIDKITLTNINNKNNKKIKLEYKKYYCFLDLNKSISFKKITKKQISIFKTFDLVIAKFLGKGEKTNHRFEKLIKEKIKDWNIIYLYNNISNKLFINKYENIDFSNNTESIDEPVITLDFSLL